MKRTLVWLGTVLASALVMFLLMVSYAHNLTTPTGYPPGYGVTPSPDPPLVP